MERARHLRIIVSEWGLMVDVLELSGATIRAVREMEEWLTMTQR